MKKIIAHSLVLLLVLTSFAVVSASSPDTDAVSAATTWTEEPTAPADPSKPAPATTTNPGPASTANIPAGSGTYVVVSGDTMAKIAAKHNLTLDQLVALNPQVNNRDLIFVGQKIVVKAAAATAAGSTAAAAGSTVAAADSTVAAADSTKVYEGMGYKVAFRNGPGADETGVPVYSFNIAMARATFDAQGRILDVFIDGYEVSTPNYDGASMPHFSGWPDKEGYNVFDHNTATISGISVNTKESAAAEVSGWLTKRQRGDSYHMNPANEWYKQMDFYQNFFKGKTVDELEAWFAKYTTTAGRPIKSDTTNADDLAKYNKLTDAEKDDLADVVSGATMSLRDAHGDFLGAVGDAYKNRHEVTITE
ncbi:MAG TPA: LysM peptidoglycan-binding domain-containing protein [Anaerovoracaceae bacterium]|nr:LysM peptidoglycan-binding domain-containing protein [Anaerovoracaceae bacterium]